MTPDRKNMAPMQMVSHVTMSSRYCIISMPAMAATSTLAKDVFILFAVILLCDLSIHYIIYKAKLLKNHYCRHITCKFFASEAFHSRRSVPALPLKREIPDDKRVQRGRSTYYEYLWQSVLNAS